MTGRATRAATRLLLAASIAALPAVPRAEPEDAAASMPAGDARTLVFTALLDGKPIGEHRYTVTATADGERLHGTATFDVKFLGITAYRYRHDDREAWTAAGCLAELTSTTDDGGTRLAVRARVDGSALAVDAPAGLRRLDGCTVSFPLLYWHAGGSGSMRPSRLVNPQDGLDPPVQIATAPDGRIAVRGVETPARHLRVTKKDGPIDLWYDADGAWVGLDADVQGRRLSYRLE